MWTVPEGNLSSIYVIQAVAAGYLCIGSIDSLKLTGNSGFSIRLLSLTCDYIQDGEVTCFKFRFSAKANNILCNGSTVRNSVPYKCLFEFSN